MHATTLTCVHYEHDSLQHLFLHLVWQCCGPCMHTHAHKGDQSTNNRKLNTICGVFSHSLWQRCNQNNLQAPCMFCTHSALSVVHDTPPNERSPSSHEITHSLCSAATNINELSCLTLTLRCQWCMTPLPMRSSGLQHSPHQALLSACVQWVTEGIGD